jgi:general secretion pathway protein A
MSLLVPSARADEFGLDPKGYFDALNSFLLELAQRGATAVLVLDEAQDLKPGTLEQIRLLSNFETNKKKLLQIILVGQPELRDLLAKPSLAQVRQRITVSTHLAPLDSVRELQQSVGQRGFTVVNVSDNAEISGV